MLNDAFASSPDLPCVYNSIVELAVQSLNAAGGMLCLDIDGLGHPVVAAAVGVTATLYGETSSEHSLANWVMRHQTSVLCSANDSRLNQEIVRRIGVKDVAAAPLALNNSIIGSLIVVDKHGGQASFDAVDLSWLSVLATQATTALRQIHADKQRQRRAWHLRVMNQILSLSLSAMDVDSLLQAAVCIMSQDFHYRSSIGMIEGDKLISKATVGYNATLIAVPLIRSLHQGITGKVATSGEPFFVPDVSREPCCHPSAAETKSELAVPLIDSNATTIGVLNIEGQTLGDFSQEDIPIFEAIAAAITHAIEHARRLRELTAFQRIAAAIGQDRTLDDMLHNTVDEVRALFHASVGAVFLADREARQLTLAYHNAYPDAVVSRLKTLKRGQSIAGKVLASGESIVVWDIRSDSRADGTITATDGLYSLIDVPIRTNHEVIGVLAVMTDTLRPFSKHDVSLLESIGNNIGVAIAKAQAEQQFHQLYQRAQVPIMTMDFDGQIRDCDEAACGITGFSRDELLSMNIVELIPGATDIHDARERLKQIARGETVAIREFVVRHNQGHHITIEPYLTPIIDGTGQPTAVQTMWRDITDRKQAEAVMQQQNEGRKI